MITEERVNVRRARKGVFRVLKGQQQSTRKTIKIEEKITSHINRLKCYVSATPTLQRILEEYLSLKARVNTLKSSAGTVSEQVIKKEEKKYKKNSNKMADTNTHCSVITLKGLNTPNKRHRLAV